MDISSFITVVMFGFLGYNGTLEEVGYYRQTQPVAIIIERDKDVSLYECRIGVPYEFRHLVGQEVYFVSQSGIKGPWLVTDVESVNHMGYMFKNKLIDIDCENYVHEEGVILYAFGKRIIEENHQKEYR